VGPAGQLLDRALNEAGIDRRSSYLTNAVKHFTFEQRGKRRIHQRPTTGEVRHYRWWLERELGEIVMSDPNDVAGQGLAATSERVDVPWRRPPLGLGYLSPTPAQVSRIHPCCEALFPPIERF
ncbi:uracil-DNA glycosylase family protein, partial [Bosea sp. UNC402CLCol]|uniref:uracil-DNA glycosylase family protein n=1 Tax=Bosea sp. UNC402CLCol TaxID=1510531 RepID=UPI0024A68BF4